MPFTDQEYFEVIEKNEIVKKYTFSKINISFFVK